MPDENSQAPLVSPQKKDIPEIDLPEESLKNYEITTMAADLRDEPTKIVAAPLPEIPLPPAPPPSTPITPPLAPPPTPLPPLQKLPEKDWRTIQNNDGEKTIKGKEDKVFEISPSEIKIPIPPQLDDTAQGVPSLKYLLIGFVTIVLLGLAGFGIYWYLGSKAPIMPPPVTPPPTPIAQVPQFDSPLVAVNKTLPLDLTTIKSAKEFFATLKDALAQVALKANEGDLVRIYPYRDGEKLKLSELMKLAQVNPIGIESYIEEDSYSFFYEQATSAQITFGLVVKVTDANNLKNNLQNLEKSALAQSPLLYKNYKGQGLSDISSPTGFLDKKYKNIDIRFINFGSPQISFDYALYNDLLFIAGSRETMFALTDRVTLGQ